MSQTAHTQSNQSPQTDPDTRRTTTAVRRSTETKDAYKTTEFIADLVAVVGVLIASAVVDASDFGAQEAWWFVSILTVGYMISRGLAKSGSREPYTDDTHSSAR